MIALLACVDPKVEVEPILTPGVLNPFPNAGLVVDGLLAIPDDALPSATTPWDTSRLAWREGFSGVQTSVVRFDVPLDAASLSGPSGLGVGGTVRLLDLTAGEEVPVFAELDAHPDATEPALLVRPQAVVPFGHEVAVVVTSGVTSGGEPLPTSQWDAEGDPALDARIGLEDVAWAWSFPVGDGTRPLRAMAAQVASAGPLVLDDLDDDSTSDLPKQTWIRAEGRFAGASWLVDDTRLQLDAEGIPQRQEDADVYVYIHVPDSVRSAAPGSVPVVVFGHGILSEPAAYLSSSEDVSRVLDLTDAMGAIVVATKWRGLTTDDLLHAVQVSGDFARIHEVTDMLAQGVANNLTLMRAVREGLLDDPAFGGLADPDQLWWYGISLGSIAGMVTLANAEGMDLAALHVGGAAWSTMLERSSNWVAFEQGVTRTFPDPWERQILYAASQLHWDLVDPASYVEDLRGRGYLWQESIGDEQVPNLTSELLFRSLELPLGAPAATAPYGLTSVALPEAGPVVTQFDPQLPLPGEGNRPAAESGAHATPRTWPGTTAQTAHYFSSGGEIAHFCGDTVCSAENPGE